MNLTNDCLDCMNAFEDTVVRNGQIAKIMRCEYQHSTFPHAQNCSTCQPDVGHASALDIGGAYVASDD